MLMTNEKLNSLNKYLDSAAKGDTESYYQAGLILAENGYDVFTQQMLRKAAEEGHIKAMVILGCLGLRKELMDFGSSNYIRNKYFTSYSPGVKWLRRAHLLGSINASIYLAWCLNNGYELEQYPKEAVSILRGIAPKVVRFRTAQLEAFINSEVADGMFAKVA